jgi:flagellar hook protein FlgE
MAFRVAISGLKAASGELDVIGNNIANSNTTGFKKSRAEFADVFAVSSVGGTGNTPGSGVRLSAIKQQFSQGNVSFTDNSLDMAINGSGFFILDDNGSQVYSRAGAFGVDRNGFLANGEGQNLIAFGADANGNITGAAGPIQVNTATIAPQASTAMTIDINLDAAQGAPSVSPFNVSNPNSFNHATSTTIYDSLGNSHLASMYYIKTEIPAVATTVAPGAYTAAVSDGNNATPTVNTVTAIAGTDGGAGGEQYILTIDGVEAANVTFAAGNTVATGAIATELDSDLATFIAGSGGAYSISSGSLSGGDLVLAKADGTAITFDTSTSTLTGVAASLTESQTTAGVTANPVTDTAFTMSIDGSQFFSEVAAIGGTVTGAELDTALTSFIAASGGAYSIASGSFATNDLVLSKADGTDAAITIDSNFSGTAGSFGGALTSTNGTPVTPTNIWDAYTFVDGTQVGGPDTLTFSTAGTLTTPAGGTVNIAAFTPAGGGATMTLAQDYSSATQFGSSFAVNALSQDGFTTGRLSGLDIDGEGIIFARFTNGQSSVQGQIALADFRNPQGLQPVSDTAWGETFSSGAVTVGAPGTASLGLIQAGALEQSNVDLSEELVNMIIAQRSFQANAEVISTSDTITQSIINLR